MSQKTNVNISIIKPCTTLDKFYEMFDHDHWRAQGTGNFESEVKTKGQNVRGGEPGTK